MKTGCRRSEENNDILENNKSEENDMKIAVLNGFSQA